LPGQRAQLAEPWPEIGLLRARKTLHSGETDLRDGDYFGPDHIRAAR
jgi:hypothetical protein